MFLADNVTTGVNVPNSYSLNKTYRFDYLEPKIDGIFHTNIMTQFPVGMNTDKPLYYTGSFKFFASSALSEGVFSKDGAFRKISVTHYDSKEEFSTKGWDVCKGL